jgi:hypothetical protein
MSNMPRLGKNRSDAEDVDGEGHSGGILVWAVAFDLWLLLLRRANVHGPPAPLALDGVQYVYILLLPAVLPIGAELDLWAGKKGLPGVLVAIIELGL